MRQPAARPRALHPIPSLLFTVVTVLLLPQGAWAQARLQLVHAAPDPAVATVDVYVDGALLVDDLAFRTATPYVDVPAGARAVDVAEASSGSSAGEALDPGESFYAETIDFQDGEAYVVVASGVRDITQYAANPDGVDVAFLLLTARAREAAADPGEVDLLPVHAAPDALAVDVAVDGGGPTLADDLAYRDVGAYTGVPPQEYVLSVTPGDDPGTVVRSVAADLSGLAGRSAVVVTSGFLTPADDQEAAAFLPFVALADGTVMRLPAAAEGDVVINEVDADTPTQPVNDALEILELYNRGSATVDLSPYVLVLYNGSDDQSYRAVDLDGFSLAPGGYLVLGSIDGADVDLSPNTVQNGADAVALYRGASAADFPGDTPATTTGLADALVYGTNDVPDNVLLAALGRGIQHDEDANNDDDLESIQRFPDGTAHLVVTTPTPGIQNLPVELAAFRVQTDADRVVLTWTTLGETGNAGFEVERQAHGAFQKIGFVEGAGTATTARHYRFETEPLAPGTYHFRLRQVDVDGAAVYSGEVEATVRPEGGFALTAAPTPFAVRTRLTLAVDEVQEVRVELYDLLGRRVRLIHAGRLAPGPAHPFAVEAGTLPSGPYFVRVTGEHFAATRRVVIVR